MKNADGAMRLLATRRIAYAIISFCILTVTTGSAYAQTLPNVQGVLNGVSYEAGVLAPGMWAAIVGSNLASATKSAARQPLPKELDGVSVTIGGIAAPLDFISPGQINVIIPFEVTQSELVPVVVTTPAGASAPFNIYYLSKDSPTLFTRNGSGTGAALAFDANFEPLTVATNSPIVLYAAGLGVTNPPALSASGGRATPPFNVVEDVSVFVGDVPATIGFAGLAPGLPGVYQLNVTPNGPISDRVYLRANGWQSNIASIPIAAGANVANVTGSISPLYPVDYAIIIPSVLLTAARFTASFDIVPGAKPFSVVATSEAGNAVININPTEGTWHATFSAPTAQSRTGNFSASSWTILDFIGGCVYAPYYDQFFCTFPGNIIPGPFDPNQVSAQKQLPLPTSVAADGVNGTFSKSGTLPADGHFDVAAVGLPAAFGGWLQIPWPASATTTYGLYVDGRLITSNVQTYDIGCIWCY
jgi:uncharacterized protein (TIGR03437 family)